MYESVSLNLDPRNRYKVYAGLGIILVEDNITNQVIYNRKKPKVRKNPVAPENPQDIFYDNNFLDFFNYGNQFFVLDVDDKGGDIVKISREMGISEYLFHRGNIEKIAKLSRLAPYTKGQIILKYMDGFIGKDRSLENFKDTPKFPKNLIKMFKRKTRGPKNIERWATKEEIKRIKNQARSHETNFR